MSRRKNIPILITILLLSMLDMLTPVEIYAQEEISPEWTYENGDKFSIVAISADENYIGAGAKNTNKFYLFQGNLLLWSYPVGNISSISMSSDGRYIAVGTKGNFYLFNRENSSPLLEYSVDYETSVVAISSDGKYAMMGTMSSTYFQNAESKLYMFEIGQPTPTWTKTLPGILESLSISSNGDCIVASASLPGIMYFFSKEQETPLWDYTFGNWSGGAKISDNGDYIVATGGDQAYGTDLTRVPRVFLFARQNSSLMYQKMVPEVPSSRAVSISSNGSIFAISYTIDEIMLFNKNIKPYGPNSLRFVSLPASRVSVIMSADGRYIFVGTAEGMFVYEYLGNMLSLKKKYTTNSPHICDIASSSDGRYVVTVGHWKSSDNEYSSIYFFENALKNGSMIDPLVQWGPLIGVVVVISGTAGFAFYRRRKISKSSHKVIQVELTIGYEMNITKRRAK